LLRALAGADVEYVLLGGVAVIAHGVIRTTRDVDICPAPDLENLQRLASMLRELGVRQLGEGEDSDEVEMPYDPTRAEDLAGGGNFRLRTPHGALDIMQWVPGIDAENAYSRISPIWRRRIPKPSTETPARAGAFSARVAGFLSLLSSSIGYTGVHARSHPARRDARRAG
jgi:hypothetical protein